MRKRKEHLVKVFLYIDLCIYTTIVVHRTLLQAVRDIFERRPCQVYSARFTFADSQPRIFHVINVREGA